MTQFRWKKVILPAVLSTLLATAGSSLAQRGGGGPGGSSGGWGGGSSGGPGGSSGGWGGGGSMRGGMNSDSSFDRLLQSYGGSGDTLDYSKVPADARQRMDTFAKMTGGQPMPTSGTLSRAQFKTDFDNRMQAMQAKMGRGPGGPMAPAPATATGTAGGPTVVMVGPGGADTKTTMTMSTGPGGGMGGPGGGMGGGGGWGGGSMDPDAMFKTMDINPTDGKISREEAMSSRSSRLGRSFDQNDTNKDGFIDQAEYKVYFAAAVGGMGGGGMGGGSGGGMGGGNWGGGGGGGNPWNNMQDPTKQPPVELEDEKPVIVRYGKLPSGMPEWFTTSDTNRDAQISLFEYCRFFGSSTDQITEFKNYDLNSDSLITAEEYLRYIKTKYSNGTPNLNGYAAPILANPAVAGPPQRGGFGPGSPPVASGGTGPTPGFGPTPAGTTPAGGDNPFNRDRQDTGSDKSKVKEKEKDAAKAESKDARSGNQDRGSRWSGGSQDRGSRTGKEPSK